MKSSQRGSPVAFEGADPAWDVSVVRRTLLAVAGVSATQALAAPFFGPTVRVGALPSLAVALAALGGLALLRRGWLRLAMLSFLTCTWLALSVSTVLFGGLRSSVLIFFPVLIIVAGLLWSERAAIGFVVASFALVTAVGWVEAQGLLRSPFPERSLSGPWLSVNLAMLVTAALVLVAVRALRAALARSRHNEERFARLFDSEPLGALAVDRSQKVVRANRKAAELLGAPGLEALVGRPVPELIHGDPQAVGEALEQALATSEVSRREVRVTTAWGRRVDVRVHVAPVPEPNGETAGLHLLLEDVSHQREMEQRLRQAEKLEAVGRLAGGIAHDFNNYLTVILASCAEIEAELPGRGELRERAGEIRAAAERAASLTRQLLTFGRRRPLRPRVVDVNTCVSESVRMLRRVLGENIELDLRLGSDVPRVWADPAEIEVALLNLAVNARDAMPSGGVIRIETRRTPAPPGLGSRPGAGEPARSCACISVGDEGPGVDPRIRDRIFEPFFTTKEEGHGTGLGLATVYAVARRAAGEVRVRDGEDGGAVFEILLPETDRREDEEKARAAVAGLHGRGSILLVEDEELVRAVLRRALETAGYHVIEARHGAEALARADQLASAPDLLVTDVLMPELGGVELAGRLRERWPRLPVLLITGHAERAEEAVRQLGRGAFLAHKPFTPNELLAQVGRILAAG